MQRQGAGPSGTFHQVLVDHGPAGPRQARRAVEEWVRQAGADRLCDDLMLIVSELVTNAVRYGAPPVRVQVSLDDHAITVSVVDSDPSAPVPRSPEPDAEGGRGLLLIDLLSEEHGVREDPPGKAVWAALAL